MNRGSRQRPRDRRSDGFTLVELLVVVVIVIIVSAATLPTILPALNNRHVTTAAQIIQAALAGARDRAIRNNEPAGIRLIPDNTIPGALTCSRIIAIEPAPDISDGEVTFPSQPFPLGAASPLLAGANWSNAGGNPPTFPFPFPGDPTFSATRGFYPYTLPLLPLNPPNSVLVVEQAVFVKNIPPARNPPTNWFWNVRIGDRLRFGSSGRQYTIVGPMTIPNPEYFVNDGAPGTSSLVEDYVSLNGVNFTPQVHPEFLFLVNAVDDNGDGYVDNGVDGVNQNLLAVVHPISGAPAVDDIAEWIETEKWLGSQDNLANGTPPPLVSVPPLPPALAAYGPRPTSPYTISRRPVPLAGAQEVQLPANAVIDLTTWDHTIRERSRLPVDPNNHYVDIMINPSGQVVPTTTFSSPSSATMDDAFYHFWIADRSDVYAATVATFPALPMPVADGDPTSTHFPGEPLANAPHTSFLTKDRQLITLFTKTGQLGSKSIENFDYTDANAPYRDAQLGLREAK